MWEGLCYRIELRKFSKKKHFQPEAIASPLTSWAKARDAAAQESEAKEVQMKRN